MGIEKTKTQLEKLKAQQEVIKARIQRVENLHKTRLRKIETRKKILLGAYYLERAEKENQWEEIKKQMDDFLTRDQDRLLFDLPPKTVVTEVEKVKNL